MGRYSRCILDAAVGELDMHDHIEKNGDDIEAIFSKRFQNMLTLDTAKDSKSEAENAIIAIEIAHGLIMKDRIDARHLGLESLCLLTDPKKTGLTTAIIASRVVLLGSAQDIKSSSSPETALLCDETPFEEKDSSEESEHYTLLHNLALAVLANALDVIADAELESNFSSDPEEVPLGRDRCDTGES